MVMVGVVKDRIAGKSMVVSLLLMVYRGGRLRESADRTARNSQGRLFKSSRVHKVNVKVNVLVTVTRYTSPEHSSLCLIRQSSGRI